MDNSLTTLTQPMRRRVMNAFTASAHVHFDLSEESKLTISQPFPLSRVRVHVLFLFLTLWSFATSFYCYACVGATLIQH